MANLDDFEDLFSESEEEALPPERSPFERLSADRQRLVKVMLLLLFAAVIIIGIIYQRVTAVDHVAMSATETVQAIERFESAEIEINGPFSGQMFNVGTNIYFSWDWLRPLNDGEQFVIRVDGAEVGRIDQVQNNTFYRLEQPTDGWYAGEYIWSVALEDSLGFVAGVPAVSATFLMTDTILASTPTIPAPATPTPLAVATP